MSANRGLDIIHTGEKMYRQTGDIIIRASQTWTCPFPSHCIADISGSDFTWESAGITIAVTTGIITKVSASSVHWGHCEESTTDLG